MLSDMIRVGTLAELRQAGVKVVHGADRPIAVFVQDGCVWAVDNRCPHLGFPLHRGTVKDGILTCHWHEARFDLCGGCTFDVWADDVQVFDTKVRGEVVYVSRRPRRREDAEYHRTRLVKGMIEGVGLVQAKSIIGLMKGASDEAGNGTGDWRAIVRTVADVACRRRQTWGSGLTYLTIVARLMEYLTEETAYYALCSATRMIASEIQDQTPRRARAPLDGSHERALLSRWMRHWVQSRHADGAELVALTAIDDGATSAELAELLFSAETDRIFANQGHSLDAINKALELVETIGPADQQRQLHAQVLPLVTPAMASSRGAEENAHWHHPHEIVGPLREVEKRLEQTLSAGEGKRWRDDGMLTATLLGDDPLAILTALEQALRDGARPTDLSRRVAHAAGVRLARFAVSNDVNDWFNPQHTFIYANAVHQALRRASTLLTVRALFHAALAVYMDRFLNVPPAPLPGERRELDDLPEEADELRRQLLAVLDQRSEIDQAGRLVARYLRLGHPFESLVDTLTYATVREDLDFHTLQVLEAGVQQYRLWAGKPEGQQIMIGVIRQLAAFCPTRRSNLQIATVALRLHRGEKIYEE